MRTQLSEAIRAARLARGLSQGELGERVGLAQSHVSKIERGTTDPQLSSLSELARGLDLELRLVPRGALPAVDSLIRTATRTGTDRQQARLRDDLNQLARAAQQGGQNALLPEADADALSWSVGALLAWSIPPEQRVSTAKIVRKLQQLLEQRRQDLTEHRQEPGNLVSIQAAIRALRHHRNQLVHHVQPDTESARPAYALDEDDDA